ncbi:hypothetical protein GH714_018794 [Hevea brasiliensis]|uniref:Disease resistance R13L4/SHOC-2-like LRR domain-containing protein n=1 Tax=Hevea brasiliensis TaxID=3981 RepID=A0A6A6LAN8_HEVBR|nr:hypothetical protein GH714_018794 [Hevea brasiliensis]
MAPQIMEMLNGLPNSTCELKGSEILSLRGCSNLEKLPPLFGFLSLQYLDLDGTALVEIPPDIVSLSSLEVLSLRDAPIEELPSSIEKLPPLYGLCSLKKLYLDGTALVKIPLDIFSLSSLRVLFLNDTPIEELPSSIGYELNFCNCVNLDQNARGTIMADAIQRIIELAIARSYPRFLVGLPGSKMPEWLSCEGPGYLIEISFPPGCFNIMFLGFVFCAILEFKAPVVHVRDLRLRCRSSFKNNNGRRLAIFSSKYFCLEKTIESDHVIFWYDGHGISSLDWLKQNYDMENKAVFHLMSKTVHRTQLEVKREANFLEQLEETANANNRRSREDFYSSNINGNQEVETHPKRLRPNFFMEDYLSNAQDRINYDATMVPSSSSCEFAPKFYKFL